jgi:hypothetical protein
LDCSPFRWAKIGATRRPAFSNGPVATSVWPIRAHGLGFRERIKGASDCCPGRRRAVLVPRIGFVVGLGFAIFRDGGAAADAEDCEEAGQAVQETPPRPLQVPQGNTCNSLVNVEMKPVAFVADRIYLNLEF